ncbi:MAG TPA: PDZ domain-containing protein, partial [Kofleriaceae bacterium]
QRRAGTAHKPKAAPVTDAATPEDPYASSAPQDPYADQQTPIAAPITAGEGGVRTAEAPDATPAPIRTAEAPNATPAPVRTIEAPGRDATLEKKLGELGMTPTDVAAPAPVEITPADQAPPPSPADLDNSAWGGRPSDAAPVPAPTPKAAAPVKAAAEKPAKATKPASKSASKKLAAQAPDSVPAVVAPPADSTVIAKADVTAALANFGALAGSVRGNFTPMGARLDSVAPDSIIAKAGLQAGDVITAINGQPLRSLDDAASLYARAHSMKAATIDIQRNGKPLTLRLAIQ